MLPPASSSTFLLTAPFATPVKIACNLFVCSSFNVDKYSLVPTFTALTYIPLPGATIFDAIPGIILPTAPVTCAPVLTNGFSICDVVS